MYLILNGDEKMGLQEYDYQNRFFCGKLFIIILYAFSLSFSGISVANTAVDWLSSQATIAGNYTDTLDIATDFQATAETVRTLYKLELVTQTELQNSISYLQADTVKNTENLSRIILSNSMAGLETTSLITDLLKHSNSDGGFADFAGYASTALDTAFALQALESSGNSDSQTVAKAISYLLNKQNPDGGYSLSDSNESNVYVTSLCLSTLQPYIFQYNLSGTISSAIEYLFSKQLIVGGWETDWETAIALSAVAPVTTDVTRYSGAVSTLKTAQNINGSWSDSVYTTALALQALHKIQHIKLPVDVNTGVLTGRVINALSGLPLQDVTVTIQGTESFTIKTEADGRYTASNLPAPQNYTVTYSSAGYQGVVQNTSVLKGQQIYLGEIQLHPLPDTGFFTGVVTDSQTGQAISGASITVSNEIETIKATTDQNGSYFLTVNPGILSVIVTAAGYTDVIASGTVVSGGTLSFSPILYSAGSPGPGDVIELRGTVIDADSLTSLQGVKVSIVGSVASNVLTDETGNFVLTDVSEGEVKLQLQLLDYQSTSLTFLVSSAGVFELGNIQLRQLTGSESSISGTVTDNVTGDVIAGATVQVMGNTSTSDVNGNFQLDGISALDFSVSARATGYLTFETQLVLQEAGPIQINIPLQAADRGELEIVSVLASQPSYDAYNLVTIRSLVKNTGIFNQDIRVLGEVIDSNEQIIHRFPLSVAHAEGEMGESVSVAASETVELEGLWPTAANVAGNYQLKIKVFDASNAELLTEKATTVAIDETKEIRLLQIKSNASYTNQGATEQIELSVAFINLSNIFVMTEYDYTVLAPDGEMIKSGVVSLQIAPDEQQKSVVIDNFVHTFDKSGIYTIELQYKTGVVASQVLTGLISVAPNERIELDQHILPSSVIPDGDKRIRIGIEIKGVQQQ